MEEYLDFLDNNYDKLDELNFKIIKKHINILDNSNYFQNGIKYSIEKKYINIIKLLLEENSEITEFIIFSLLENFDIDIIIVFLNYNLNIDKLLKLSIIKLKLLEEKYIELLLTDNFYDFDKSYLVNFAAHNGYNKLLSCLLYNKQNKTLQHSLLHAIDQNHKECIQTLVTYGADLNLYTAEIPNCKISNFPCGVCYCKRGIYPIVCAIKKNNIFLVNYLLKLDATFEIINIFKNINITNICIYHNYIDMLQLLLDNNIKLKINYKDDKNLSINNTCTDNIINFNDKSNTLYYTLDIENYYMSPLICFLLCILRNKFYIEPVKMLRFIFKNSDLDPNLYCNNMKLTPISLLCHPIIINSIKFDLYLKIFNIFINNGGNVNYALLLLSSINDKLLKSYKKHYKSDIDIIKISKIIKILINIYDADINYKNSSGYSPLIMAVYSKNYKIVYTLLELGADPNITDLNNNTALNYTLIEINNYNNIYDFNDFFGSHIKNNEINLKYLYHSLEIVDFIKLLCSYGANLNLEDNNGLSFNSYISDIITIINTKSVELYLDILELYLSIERLLNNKIILSTYYLYKLNNEEFEKDILPKLPNEYLCPISKYPFIDPVISSDGYTYERVFFNKYISYSDKSPILNTKLENTQVFPNIILQNIVKKKILELIDELNDTFLI